MIVDELRKYCRTLPAATEEIKWGNDLCFCVGGKMFCVVSLTSPLGISFKVKDDDFDEMVNTEGFMPAPYIARYKWVFLQNVHKVSKEKLEFYIKQSYDLVKLKLSKKVLSRL